MDAYITKAANFFPNAPVNNEEMEDHLGMIHGHPSRAKSLVLLRNGIQTRYYALDKQGKVTHTNVQMAAESVRKLLGDSHLAIDDIDVLACGTATPEQIMPSHGVMVHGELGGNTTTEVVSFAGSCCAGIDALKYAAMTVRLGDAHNAIASASERMSAWMRAPYFQQESDLLSRLNDEPILAFDKEFLRWMLSDGAVALLVQPKPNADALSLHIDWIEITSFANQLETCMYAGAVKNDDGSLTGWAMLPQQEWLSNSVFALKQDARLLGRTIVKMGGQYLLQLSRKHHFSPDDIDWFMPHLSSMYFKDKIMQELEKLQFPIPEQRWFINLPKVGNIASASAFAMLEEAMHNGMLKRGQRILMMIPESARFSYAYCMLTVC